MTLSLRAHPPLHHPTLSSNNLELVANQPPTKAYPTFKRARIPETRYLAPFMPAPQINGQPSANYITTENGVNCVACKSFHPVGSCPLKLAGVEYCNLCGMAHYGAARVCPHIQSETQVRLEFLFAAPPQSSLNTDVESQVRAMLESLKYSTEQEHVVAEAKRYLKGLKGNLVQLKKQKAEKVLAEREKAAQAEHERRFMAARGPVWR